MPKRTFKNVPLDVLEFAENAVQDFELRGFKVSIEKSEISFPYTPTFLCKRPPTTIIVEFFSKILIDRVENWVSYARSTGRDTRIAICLPPNSKVSDKDEQKLRDLGVGLYIAREDETFQEIIVPNDLALNLMLPSLKGLSLPIRQALGPAYEQFKRSHWREGFVEACQSLENASKKYFKIGINNGRITVARAAGKPQPTSQQIDRYTMGQLAQEFTKIISQTHKDKLIGKALKETLEDRNKVTHNKGKGVTETRLRKNVGLHMWTIVAAMKELI